MAEQDFPKEAYEEIVARLESLTNQTVDLVAQAAHGNIPPGLALDSYWIPNPNFNSSFPNDSVLVARLRSTRKPLTGAYLRVFYYPPTAQGKIGSIFRFLRISPEQLLSRICLTTPDRQFDILRRGNRVIPAETIIRHSFSLHFPSLHANGNIFPLVHTLVPNRKKPEEVAATAVLLEAIIAENRLEISK